MFNFSLCTKPQNLPKKLNSKLVQLLLLSALTFKSNTQTNGKVKIMKMKSFGDFHLLSNLYQIISNKKIWGKRFIIICFLFYGLDLMTEIIETEMKYWGFWATICWLFIEVLQCKLMAVIWRDWRAFESHFWWNILPFFIGDIEERQSQFGGWERWD